MSTTKHTLGAVMAVALLATSHPFAAAPKARKPAQQMDTSKTLAPKSPITITLSHTMMKGDLVVLLDDRPIFNESFDKPFYIIQQTTTWDPVLAPSGKHKLTAQVNGKKGKTVVSGIYELELSRTKGIEVHLLQKGGKLSIVPTS
jgi:hypothetical protein